ncbi:putative O-glycosylation ligase, exosortase A system-associated [Propionivibrio limicola]|uniref:putative O-glycosylation ligase, exosortase A system-associated n=1 Tax=Propionivibrio limicola TaxID=167645 RepID=UPI0012922B2D|nr:putative O-glycosylation ligase, exosortase A system-associated [Propionivibrio limicola]
MRDLLITAVVIALIPLILRTPRFGAYVWAWLSMMNPHRAAWGFARSFPFAYLVALSTLIGFLFSREKKPFPVTPITVVYLSFWFWMSFTCLFAMNTPEIVLERWIFVSKIHLMLLVTLMLIRGREQIEGLVWVVTASIGFYGVKGGIWTVLTGGGSGRVWGPPDSMISDNNGLALALVVLLPFVYYLYQVSSRRWLRWGLVFSGVAICFSILGSHSRGALLALIAMAFMLALKGKRPFLMSFLIVAVLTTAILSMPEIWASRMESILNYEQDASAMSRITTWTTLWNLVMDRPILGAGFRTDNPLVFALYAPEGWEGKVLVAHSIYFEALGEHGFPGFFLYLGLFFLSWMRAGKLARLTRDDPEFSPWVPFLMRMVQVSLTGFAVGGAFLSLVHFDLPYYILAFVILVDATVRERMTGVPVKREG